ncbi:MAG: sulfur carrier protein ThiS [Deltaproteobacteria bacterium]|nr:sulfur carrier protein ThiS [Deltaproteobacteria bacterium]
MKIKLNGKEETIESGLTVEGLLKRFSIGADAIAVEINREIVPKRTHAAVILNDGDKVEIVKMVGGG